MTALNDHSLMRAFKRAGAKPEGGSCNNLLDAILQERPDLKGQPVYTPEQGKFARTIIIGDEVFKGVVKNDKDYMALLDHEAEVTGQLAAKGLPVPEVTCVGRDYVFFGMKRIPGVVAGNDLDKTLTADEQRQLAKDVIGFIGDMAKANPAADGRFLVHGDLHGGNIMIDPETKKFTGVIDFGRTTMCKRDEWQPHWILPESFRKILAEEYGRRKGELPEASAERATPAQNKGISHG